MENAHKRQRCIIFKNLFGAFETRLNLDNSKDLDDKLGHDYFNNEKAILMYQK